MVRVPSTLQRRVTGVRACVYVRACMWVHACVCVDHHYALAGYQVHFNKTCNTEGSYDPGVSV